MVYAIGSALIDMLSDNNKDCFQPYAGGAAANVAATVAKLGGNSALICKIGNDYYGKYVINVLQNIGVDISKVFYDNNRKTGIIYFNSDYIVTEEIYAKRKDSADRFLDEKEINPDWFTKNDILHFCTICLTDYPAKKANIKAIQNILKKGGKVSFDINYKPKLWENKQEFLDVVQEFIIYPHYLKVSNYEVEAIFENDNYDKCIEILFNKGKRLEYIFLTKGHKGVSLYLRNGKKFSVAAYKTNVIDTLGAGDCFIGSMLYNLNKINHISEQDLKEFLHFSSACSALQCEKKGAIDSIPYIKEVEELINA